MRTRIVRVAAILGGLLLSVANGAEVRLQGDTVTINAESVALREVLLEFGRYGVAVRMDPAINTRVTAHFNNRDAQEALKTLLEPFGYVLVWDLLRGPLGPMPRLAEIQVFRPGQKEKIRSLQSTNTFHSATAGTGPAWVKDEIILGFRAGVTREQAEQLLNRLGATLLDSIPGIGAYRVRLPPGSNVLELVARLRQDSLVAAVEPNWIVPAPAPAFVGASDAKSGLRALTFPSRAMTAPVAVIDSGLAPLPELKPAVVAGLDAVNPDQPLSDPAGHGTQMALVASGLVSPDGAYDTSGDPVQLVAARAFDKNGNASSSSLLKAIAFAVDSGARVLNLSWGTETSSEFLAAAIRQAQDEQVIVVAAAGNDGTTKPIYPAAYPGVIAVSALEANGVLWSKSNRGDYISLAAPGIASFPIGYNGPAGTYAGTSIASAYVAHALGAYFVKHPNATPEQAKQALNAALAVPGGQVVSPGYGHGLLSASAVDKLLSTP